MNDTGELILALFAGFLLGIVFFGGLWWTIRKGLRSPRPAVWFLGSLVVRTTIAVIGFHLVARGRWENLLLCLLGFIMARMLVMRRVHSPALLPCAAAKETEHAT